MHADSRPTEGSSIEALPFSRLAFGSLKGDWAFKRVRTKGKAGRSNLLTFRWLARRVRRNELPSVALGIVVSKKVGKAVVRNRVRRRLREAARRMDWPLIEAMIVVSPEAATATYAELQRALRAATAKSGLK